MKGNMARGRKQLVRCKNDNAYALAQVGQTHDYGLSKVLFCLLWVE